jgi:hypothetical protein
MSEQDRTSRKLDQALEMTFPASDPISVGAPTGTEPPARPVDRSPPLITKDQIDAAERGEGHSHRDQSSFADDGPLSP